MADELILKIGADTKDVEKSFSDLKLETTELDRSFGEIAKASGEIFDKLVEQVSGALKAFANADQASKELSNALQNQGIFTSELKDKYKEYAEAVELSTGFSETEITKSQAVAQSFLGQMAVTEDLTKATADLAQKMGIGLSEAASILGKEIGNGTGQLGRMGLQFSATDTEADRYQKTLDFVALKAGGMAAAANTGLGAIRGLSSAFEASEVELGSRFAPIMGTVIKLLTDFIRPVKESSGFLFDLKAAFLVVGIAITGVAVALPVLAQGFLAVRAAAIALEVGMAPLILIPALVIAAVAGIGLLAVHWKDTSNAVIAIVKDMVGFISESFSGLGKVLSGALHLDPSKISEGLKEIGNAFVKVGHDAAAGWNQASTEVKKGLEVQEQAKKEFALKEDKLKKEHEENSRQLLKAENQYILLELNGASKAQLDLKKKEVETLKQIETNKNEHQKELLKKHLTDIRALENTQVEQDKQRDAAYAEYKKSAQENLNAHYIKSTQNLTAEENAELAARVKTEEDVQKDADKEAINQQTDIHNRLLADKHKFGVAYAAINQAMHSEVYKGSKSAFGELAQLQNSSNSTLKEIGKVAAVANITIKTAESAMNVFEGFSTIPFVGTALGIAAAAAVIAYGAEQIGNVTSAADGGLMTGGIAGKDSIPTLTMPGELVVPTKNFDEVVGAVQDKRGQGGKSAGNSSGMAQIEISLKGDLMDFIETKIVQRKNLGISIQGS